MFILKKVLVLFIVEVCCLVDVDILLISVNVFVLNILIVILDKFIRFIISKKLLVIKKL